MQIVLKLVADSQAGRQITLPSVDCILGRGDTCGVRLTSQQVSRRHCRIKVEDGQVWATDLGSRNGTFVNDQRLAEPLVLRSGDMLRVGNYKFELELVDESVADSPAASWAEFCRAVSEIDATKTSEEESLQTVDMPKPLELPPTDHAAATKTPGWGRDVPQPLNQDSRSAAHEALRRYFSGN